MKKTLFSFLLFITLVIPSYAAQTRIPAIGKVLSINFDDLQDGDIIFQSSNSPLSIAIQLATKSKYSHCGIIFKEKGAWYVYEAVQPVRQLH